MKIFSSANVRGGGLAGTKSTTSEDGGTEKIEHNIKLLMASLIYLMSHFFAVTRLEVSSLQTFFIPGLADLRPLDLLRALEEYLGYAALSPFFRPSLY
jgi:hypothetical protein